jgi:tRNA(fMet)-specific endonuclease VapC
VWPPTSARSAIPQGATSIVVAAELWYEAAKKRSPRLTTQLEIVLGAPAVLPLETPVDLIYGDLCHRLGLAGRPIGSNDLHIASQAIALGHILVDDNEREFARIEDLPLANWLR